MIINNYYKLAACARYRRSEGFYNSDIFGFIDSRYLVKDIEYISILKAANYYRFVTF
jgi:hypothetical protein